MKIALRSNRRGARGARRCAVPLLAAALALALAAAAPAARAQAQGYPNKPVRMVIGFAAGAGSDAIARVIVEKVGRQLGQNVIMDNKPGANGAIANEAAATAAPDGYTLYWNTSSVLFNALLDPKVGDATAALRRFAPITLASNNPLVLIVRPDLPVGDLRSFIAHAKANSGRLNYASGGIGNITHLASASFLKQIGADATHVPYKSANDAVSDLASSRTDFYFYTLSGSLPFIKGNRVKALAVAGLKRAASLPNVPTVSDVLPGFQVGSWTGVMAPAGTPREIVERLNREFGVALRDPDIKAKMDAQDVDLVPTTPQEYAEFLAKENDTWRRVIRDANIKVE